VNVLIVGAGIIGVSIADELARRGASVTVLDMRSAGGGASQASAGILAPYTEAHEGKPLLELGTRSLALFDAFISRARESSGRTIEYARTGTLEIALDEADEARLRHSKGWLDGIGVAAEWLSGAEVRAFEPAVNPSARAGLFNPNHGWVGVRSLVGALVESAKRASAIFESPVEAIDITPRAAGADVRAGDQQYGADVVILAAGSWSGRVRVAGIEPLPIRPVRGQLLHLQSAQPQPSRVVWGSGCYIVPWPDGSLLVGATVEEVGFDERVTEEAVRTLAEAAAELLPAAKGAKLVETRVGLRPAAPDGLPVIGPFRDAPTVIAATGHYRNGVLLAPLTAALVAGLVLEGRQDSVFEIATPNRFATEGEWKRL
jgi:glycine oxidase